MSWANQPSQSDFRLILTRVSDLKIGNHLGAFYIGVGDQFDDDRRLVRETASALRLTAHPPRIRTEPS
jgi:hypothetical protein